MDHAYPSPSFVLPPLSPGLAWAWTSYGWTPIPYTGPTLTLTAAAAPSSTAPSSPAPLAAPSPAAAAPIAMAAPSPSSFRSFEEGRDMWIALAKRDPRVAAASHACISTALQAHHARERCAAALAALGVHPANADQFESMARLGACFDRTVAESFHAWTEGIRHAEALIAPLCEAVKQANTATPIPASSTPPASSTATPPTTTPTPSAVSPSHTRMSAPELEAQLRMLLDLAKRDHDVAALLAAWMETLHHARRTREQCARALTACGFATDTEAETESVARKIAPHAPPVAEALRAWDDAKRTAESAAVALRTAVQKSRSRQAATTAAPSVQTSSPATPNSAASIATASPSTAASVTSSIPDAASPSVTGSTPDAASPSVTGSTGPASDPSSTAGPSTTTSDTAAPQPAPAADLLADLPPWVIGLSQHDARVSYALGDLYTARDAQRSAELHAARLLATCGPAPLDHAQSIEWVAQLARARPDVAQAMGACMTANEAASRAEAALSQAIASHAPPGNAPDPSSLPESTTRPRVPEHQEHALENGGAEPAALLAWAHGIADHDPRVARALGDYLAAEETSRDSTERFAAALAPHGPAPAEPAARTAWMRAVMEHDPHAAAAMRAGLAAMAELERAAAHLAEALRPYARAPPRVVQQ